MNYPGIGIHIFRKTSCGMRNSTEWREHNAMRIHQRKPFRIKEGWLTPPFCALNRRSRRTRSRDSWIGPTFATALLDNLFPHQPKTTVSPSEMDILLFISLCSLASVMQNLMKKVASHGFAANVFIYNFEFRSQGELPSHEINIWKTHPFPCSHSKLNIENFYVQTDLAIKATVLLVSMFHMDLALKRGSPGIMKASMKMVFGPVMER